MTISMPRRCLDRWIDRLLEHEPNWSAKENSCISFVILQCQLMPSIVIADDCRDLLQGDRALEDVRGHAQDNGRRIMATGHGRWAFCSTRIAIPASSLGVGGGSARTTGSRKEISAPSTSSRPHCGTSTSRVMVRTRAPLAMS